MAAVESDTMHRNVVSRLREVPSGVWGGAALVFLLSIFASLPLGLGEVFQQLFCLIPAKTVGNFHVWNPFTGLFVETNAIAGLLVASTFLVAGKWLEPAWGQRELIRFILIMNGTVGYTTFFLYSGACLITQKPNICFALISGCIGLVTASTVALKQLIPENQIKLFRSYNIKAKHLTAIVVTSTLVLCVVGLLGVYKLIMSLLGAYYGWLYLRFFQVRDKGIGDQNSAFSFQSFFPRQIQPFIGSVSTRVYKTFTPIVARVHQSVPTSVDEEDPSATPNVSEDDLERRRQIAMKALNERLQANIGDEPTEERQTDD
ncbi:hypothetical protein NDN08_002956 [Rhodosorus marinus]|uniref:Transmembrane protein 115 n=1 Tax=Rhodosorus marinus TaxID=101924 RepID=A0AAV8UXW3_9RHOD|nr:hypothetical protein NDN08_002956 [Rhodosorus marinus]